MAAAAAGSALLGDAARCLAAAGVVRAEVRSSSALVERDARGDVIRTGAVDVADVGAVDDAAVVDVDVDDDVALAFDAAVALPILGDAAAGFPKLDVDEFDDISADGGSLTDAKRSFDTLSVVSDVDRADREQSPSAFEQNNRRALH